MIKRNITVIAYAFTVKNCCMCVLYVLLLRRPLHLACVCVWAYSRSIFVTNNRVCVNVLPPLPIVVVVIYYASRVTLFLRDDVARHSLFFHDARRPCAYVCTGTRAYIYVPMTTMEFSSYL